MNGKKPSASTLKYKDFPLIFPDDSTQIEEIKKHIFNQIQEQKLKDQESIVGAISIGVKYALEKQRLMIFEALNAIKYEVKDLEKLSSGGTQQSYLIALKSDLCPHSNKIRDIIIRPSVKEDTNLDIAIAFKGEESTEEQSLIKDIHEYIYRDDIRPVCDFPNVILVQKVKLEITVLAKLDPNTTLERVLDRLNTAFHDFILSHSIGEAVEYNSLMARLYVEGIKNIKFIKTSNRFLKNRDGENIFIPGKIVLSTYD